MQIILNCKSQSKDNQMTHCAIEPFHCFRKQPWSEGHRQRRNILCPLFFKRRADNNFSKPYLNLQNRSLPNQSRNVNLKTRSWIKCWHHTAFQGQKKKNTFPYNLLCWVYRSTDTGIKNKPQHKKKKDARGVYLPSQSLKTELCQERLFLYVWDVTPELWRFSLHLLVRGNQPQSAKFIEEMYIKTSLCYN